MHSDSSVSPKSLPSAQTLHEDRPTASQWIPQMLLGGNHCRKTQVCLQKPSGFYNSTPSSQPLAALCPHLQVSSLHAKPSHQRLEPKAFQELLRPSEHIFPVTADLFTKGAKMDLPTESSCLP